jgi:hypothetical protein
LTPRPADPAGGAGSTTHAYRSGADGAPDFIEAGAPTDEELHALLQTVIARPMKMLTRRGVPGEARQRSTGSALPDQHCLSCLCA